MSEGPMVVVGGHGSGKTSAAVRWLLHAPTNRAIIVPDEHRAQEIADRVVGLASERGILWNPAGGEGGGFTRAFFQRRIMTVRQLRLLDCSAGWRPELWVDSADEVIRQALGQPLASITAVALTSVLVAPLPGIAVVEAPPAGVGGGG